MSDEQWIGVENGYHEAWQYIDSAGRIIGGVRGSAYEKSTGWHAHIEKPERVNLGRFVSPELAKKAVEATSGKR